MRSNRCPNLPDVERLSRLARTAALSCSSTARRAIPRWAGIRSWRPTRSTGSSIPADGTATPLATLVDELRSRESCRNRHRARICRRFKAARRACSATTWAARWNDCPAPRSTSSTCPRWPSGLYDVVLAFDHARDRAWLISQGLPEADAGTRRNERAERLRRSSRPGSRALPQPQPSTSRQPRCRDSQQLPLRESLAPQFPMLAGTGADQQLLADRLPAQPSQRAIEYIHAGDVFQVNLAQRLLHPADDDSVVAVPAAAASATRPRSPATSTCGEFQIASASPERFLQVARRQVETRPIKGTRPPLAWPEADLFAGDELQASEKDRAENVMIVDLLRNDLSRVCRADSVRVTRAVPAGDLRVRAAPGVGRARRAAARVRRRSTCSRRRFPAAR